MKIEEIRNKLMSWSQQITSAYIGLKVRFEYSESRGVFLVSLYTDEIADIERFSVDIMSFEDEMEDMYGYDTPLFCDNEELFTLSSEAEIVVGISEIPSSQKWHFQIEDLFEGISCHNLAA